MIREMLLSNLWLKIASLILAIILWFFVVMSVHSDIVIEVPVKFINTPQNIEIVDGGKTVRLGIEGQERILTALNQNDISVVIDLGKAKAGKNFYSLSLKDVKLPGMLSVKSITPQTLSLALEERSQKTVSVKPVIVGLPEEGYSVDSIIIRPERVIIEGPESLIKRVKSVKTEPIDITRTVESLSFSALLDITGLNLRTNVREVEVSITVGETK